VNIISFIENNIQFCGSGCARYVGTIWVLYWARLPGLTGCYLFCHPSSNHSANKQTLLTIKDNTCRVREASVSLAMYYRRRYSLYSRYRKSVGLYFEWRWLFSRQLFGGIDNFFGWFGRLLATAINYTSSLHNFSLCKTLRNWCSLPSTNMNGSFVCLPACLSASRSISTCPSTCEFITIVHQS
jgi:hypothetical protein